MTRAVSMMLALTASGILMIVPFILAHRVDAAVHGFASLMMIGVTGAFIHGIGFVPRAIWLRLLFSPILAWPLVIGPAIWLALH